MRREVYLYKCSQSLLKVLFTQVSSQIGLQTSAGYGSLPHSRQCHPFSLHLPHGSSTTLPSNRFLNFCRIRIFTTQLTMSSVQFTFTTWRQHHTSLKQVSNLLPDKDLYHTADNVISSVYIYHTATRQFLGQTQPVCSPHRINYCIQQNSLLKCFRNLSMFRINSYTMLQVQDTFIALPNDNSPVKYCRLLTIRTTTQILYSV